MLNTFWGRCETRVFVMIYIFNPLKAELNPICHLLILLGDLMFMDIRIISIFQQDATLHNLFISGNCFTCFGSYFHPSSGAHTIVSTASGICHTVTAICRYRGSVGTGLSVLWVATPPVCVLSGRALHDQTTHR
jgi:hypothetical protein